MTLLETALMYLKAGFSILPVRIGGSKSPALDKWGQYQKERPSEKEVSHWFVNREKGGIGIICGPVSGGLEVLDFDQPNFFDSWQEIVNEDDKELLKKLPTIKTPKGYGRHVYFRSKYSEAGLKLAYIPKEKTGEVAIETRGDKQYVIAPGSHSECHELNVCYEHISGPPIIETPEITEKEREILLNAARRLNRYTTDYVGSKKSSLRPGDNYNKEDKWEVLLEKHGWKCIKQKNETESEWRRPGKDKNTNGATLGHCINEKGNRLLYVFSTNAGPFEAGRSYSLFAAYTTLEHNGDFRAAAQELARLGYGELYEASDEFIAEIKTIIDKVLEEKPETLPDKANKKILAFCENNTTFKQTWELKRKELDIDFKQYFTSLIRFLKQVKMTAEEVVRCLYQWTRNNKDLLSDDVEFDPKWIADQLTRLEHQENITEEKCLANNFVENTKKKGFQEILNKIREFIGLDEFALLIKIGKENPIYHIKLTNDQLIKIGQCREFQDQKQFREPLINQKNHVMPEMVKWKWEGIMQLMLLASETVSLEDDSELIDTENYIDAYLEQNPPEFNENWKVAIKYESPFYREDSIYIFPARLFKFICEDNGTRMALNDLRARLFKLGFRAGTESSRIGQKVFSKWYYSRKQDPPVKIQKEESSIPDTLPEDFGENLFSEDECENKEENKNDKNNKDNNWWNEFEVKP